MATFAPEVSSWFNDDPALIEWSATYLRMMAPALAVIPVSIVISQAMVARNRLRIPVIVDSAVLLLGMTPALIIALVAGGGTTTLIIINVATCLLLAGLYVGIRLAVLRKSA